MIANIFFDLDGTLIDSSAGIEHSARHAVRSVLPGVELPPLRPYIGPPVREVLSLALTETGAPLAGLAGSIGDIERQFRGSYDSEGWRLSEPYDGAADVLRELNEQSMRCFIVTNKPRFSAEKICQQLGLSRLTVEVLCRDSRDPAFASKAEALGHLLARRELSAEQSVFVGDSPDDASAAADNGVAFIAARYGYGLCQRLPANAIAAASSVREIPAILARLQTNHDRFSHPDEARSILK